MSQCAAILQVFNIAETFRARDIPCDGIHIDVDFADRYKTFTYNPDTFPGIYELFEVLSSKVWLSLELRQASHPLSCLAMCPDLQPTLDARTGIARCCKLVLNDTCAVHELCMNLQFHCQGSPCSHGKDDIWEHTCMHLHAHEPACGCIWQS